MDTDRQRLLEEDELLEQGAIFSQMPLCRFLAPELPLIGVVDIWAWTKCSLLCRHMVAEKS